MPGVIYFIYLIPLFLSAVFSLKSFRLKWPLPYRYFSIFLIITFLVEIFAICWKVFLFKHISNDPSNIWIYNLYIVPEYLFYLFFYYLILEKHINKKSYLLICAFYCVLALTNIAFIQKIQTLNSYTIIVGNIILIALSLHYFISSLQVKEPILQTTLPVFWISVAVFIFSAGSLPYFIFLNYLIKENIAMAIALFNILLILNTLGYSLYLIAYLCNPPIQRQHTSL